MGAYCFFVTSEKKRINLWKTENNPYLQIDNYSFSILINKKWSFSKLTCLLINKLYKLSQTCCKYKKHFEAYSYLSSISAKTWIMLKLFTADPSITFPLDIWISDIQFSWDLDLKWRSFISNLKLIHS